MFIVYVHRDAAEDLKEVFRVNKAWHALIVALIQQIKADPKLIDSLTIQHYGIYGSEPYHVQRINEQQKAKRNLWRIKIWDPACTNATVAIPYRIIYALDAPAQRIYILGVIDREHCYNLAHPRIRQLAGIYEFIGVGYLS